MTSGQRTFAVSLLHKLNITPTPQNVRALVGWEKAEGGHWNNDARYNPLNTTQPMPGAGNTGTQGNIKVYRSWQQGLDATARTLRNGRYGNILKALRSGTPGQVAQAIGQSPWGTSASLVQSVIGGTPAQATGTPTPRLPKQPKAPHSAPAPVGPSADQARFAAYTAYAANPHVPGASTDLALSLLNAQRQQQATPTPAPKAHAASNPNGSGAGTSGSVRGAHRGDPVVRGTSIGGLHQTAGLAGYPAHDYFAPAGSPVVAPVSGTVHKLSGHDPKLGPPEGPGGPLGWSVYIKGDDGRDYFLTHMGSRNVRVGERVTQGTRIGTVANYHSYGRPDHIHMGVRG